MDGLSLLRRDTFLIVLYGESNDVDLKMDTLKKYVTSFIGDY